MATSQKCALLFVSTLYRSVRVRTGISPEPTADMSGMYKQPKRDGVLSFSSWRRCLLGLRPASPAVATSAFAVTPACIAAACRCHLCQSQHCTPQRTRLGCRGVCAASVVSSEAVCVCMRACVCVCACVRVCRCVAGARIRRHFFGGTPAESAEARHSHQSVARDTKADRALVMCRPACR